MGETSDGQPAVGPGMSEDPDPDSPARPSFFSRLFRRKVGLTPVQYRRRFGDLRRSLTPAH